MHKQVVVAVAAVFALALAGGCATAQQEESASQGSSISAEQQRLNPIGFPSGE